MEQTLFREDGAGDPAEIALAMDDLEREIACFGGKLDGDYLTGALSLADFTLYPLLALVKRLHQKQPQHGAGGLIPPNLAAFMTRMEQLPYFAKTIPPHWKG